MGFPNDAQQAGLYTQQGIQNEYLLVPGACVLPLAEDPPQGQGQLAAYTPVVVLQLHAPYRVRTAAYKSDKTNNPPPAPSPGDTGLFVFVGGSVQIGNTINTTYRNYDWQVGTVYTYVENCVSRHQDGFVLGLPPFLWESSRQNVLNTGIPPAPQVGAVSQAGYDPRIGVAQGNAIVANQIGNLNDQWGYNVSSYYPGTLLYDHLTNGGDPSGLPS
jgi:hypothetical protein